MQPPAPAPPLPPVTAVEEAPGLANAPPPPLDDLNEGKYLVIITSFHLNWPLLSLWLAILNLQLEDAGQPPTHNDAANMQVDDPQPPSAALDQRHDNGSNDDISEPNPNHGRPPSPPQSSCQSVAGSLSSPEEDYVPIWSLHPLNTPNFDEEWQLEAHRTRELTSFTIYSLPLLTSTVGVSEGMPLDSYAFCLIKTYKWQIEMNIRANMYAKYRDMYPELGLPSLKVLHGKMSGLTSVLSTAYDCCPNVCICFVGTFTDLPPLQPISIQGERTASQFFLLHLSHRPSQGPVRRPHVCGSNATSLAESQLLHQQPQPYQC